MAAKDTQISAEVTLETEKALKNLTTLNKSAKSIVATIKSMKESFVDFNKISGAGTSSVNAAMKNYAQNFKLISSYLKTIQTQLAGFDALKNQSIFKGVQTNLLFGSTKDLNAQIAKVKVLKKEMQELYGTVEGLRAAKNQASYKVSRIEELFGTKADLDAQLNKLKLIRKETQALYRDAEGLKASKNQSAFRVAQTETLFGTRKDLNAQIERLKTQQERLLAQYSTAEGLAATKNQTAYNMARFNMTYGDPNNTAAQLAKLNIQQKGIQSYYLGSVGGSLSSANINISGNTAAELAASEKQALLAIKTSDEGIVASKAKVQKSYKATEEAAANYKLEQQGVSEETIKGAKRFATLDQSLGLIQLKLLANYAAINKVVGSFQYLLNYTAQYDEELHQLQAISAVSDKGLKGLKTTIEDVANSTKFTSLEVAQASTVLAQAGLTVSQIEKTLPAIANLATATGTDLATSTDVITSTLNIYNLQVTEATRVTNSLTTAMNESKADISGFQTAIQYAGNFAAQLGMTYEETASAIAAATQAGIRSKSMLGTGLRAVLTEFLKPTDKLVAQLAKVGLTVDDINVKSKGFVNVLRTLSNAGFGAEEAFKGMERRGAAFLAALINQTDYMDDLRMKMAGSTAASKANETQMEALTNQWKNFQSVAATAAYNGLEPFVKLLKELLKIINNTMKSTAGSGIMSVIFGTIGVAGTTAATALLAASLVKIVTQVGAFYTLITKFKRVENILSAGKSLPGLNWVSSLMNLAAGGKITLIVAALAGLASAVYMVVDRFGLLNTALDKAQANMEEAKGKVDEASQKVDVLKDLLNRLYENREKLDSQSERNIFVREILTRFPEAIGMIDATAASFEDIVAVVEKLNATSLDNFISKSKEAADAAAKLAYTNVKDLSDNYGVAGFLPSSLENIKQKRANLQSQLASLAQAGDVSNVSANIPDTQLLLYSLKDAASRKTEIQNAITDVIKSLVVQASKQGFNQKETIDYLQTVRSSGTENFKDLLPLLDAEIEKLTRDLETQSLQTQKALKETFSDEYKDTNEKVYESIKEANEVIRKVNATDTIGLEKTDSQIQQLVKTYEALKENSEQLRYFTDTNGNRKALSEASTVSDLAAIKGISVKDAQTLLDNFQKTSGITDAKEAIRTIVGDKMDKTNSSLIAIEEVLSKISERLGKIPGFEGYAPAESGALSKLREDIANKTKRLGGISNQSKFASTKQDIAGSIEHFRQQAYIAAGITGSDNLSSQQKADQANIDLAISRMNSDLNNVQYVASKARAEFDSATVSMTYFFDQFKAKLKEIDTTYIQAIANLDNQLAIAEGRVTGAERVYGSSSVITQAEQIKAQNLQDSQLNARTAAAQAKLNAYKEQRNRLWANKGYQNAMSAYQKAKDRYDLVGQSGDAAATHLAYEQLKDVSKNYRQYADQEKSLEDTIASLEAEVTKNTEALSYESKLKGMSGTDQIKTGFNSAVTTYAESNKGIGTIAGVTGEFTSNAISTMDNAFSTMFSNIASGSAKASDAFRDFGKQVLQTLRDIAIQMAVKQGLTAVLSAFGGGINGVRDEGGDVNSSFSFIKTAAVGGLVNGPVKNRDSVNMQLMPGEYVLKKSAVDVVGRDYLDSLNSNTSSVISESASQVEQARTTESGRGTGAGSVTNVYVVGQEQQKAMTPNDVIVTITQDMLQGGQTKKLVKSIASGSI